MAGNPVVELSSGPVDLVFAPWVGPESDGVCFLCFVLFFFFFFFCFVFFSFLFFSFLFFSFFWVGVVVFGGFFVLFDYRFLKGVVVVVVVVLVLR